MTKELVQDLIGFAEACGAKEAGDGAFRVVTLSGSGSAEMERNLRATLRDAASEIERLSSSLQEARKAEHLATSLINPLMLRDGMTGD